MCVIIGSNSKPLLVVQTKTAYTTKTTKVLLVLLKSVVVVVAVGNQLELLIAVAQVMLTTYCQHSHPHPLNSSINLFSNRLNVQYYEEFMGYMDVIL